MKSSKRFWLATFVGAVALLVLRYALVAPVLAESEGLRRKVKGLASEREGYFPKKGQPIAEAKAEAEAEREKLAALEQSLGRIELALPPELEDGPGRTPLYFQKQRNALKELAAKSGLDLKSPESPFGFPQEIAAEDVGQFLARLEVARRFLEAAKAAGARGVLGAEHPAERSVLREGLDSQIVELPLRVTVAADEKGLIRLVQELSRPRSFLALKGLKVAVEDPASGAFEAALEVAGVRVKAAPVRPETTEAAPRPTEGQPVPTRRRRY